MRCARLIEFGSYLPRGDYGLTLACLAPVPGITIGHTVPKTATNAEEFVMQAKFVLSFKRRVITC